MANKIRVASKKGHKGSDSPLKTWVMIGSRPGEPPEYGEWLTPAQAYDLSRRLLKAAQKAEYARAMVE